MTHYPGHFGNHSHHTCRISFKHSFPLLIVLCITYIFHFYLSDLISTALNSIKKEIKSKEKKEKLLILFIESIAYSFTLILSLFIDFTLSHTPIFLMLAIYIVLLIQRLNNGFNIIVCLSLDIAIFGGIYLIQVYCLVKFLYFLKFLVEFLKFFTMSWSHDTLTIVNYGKFQLVFFMIEVLWISLFYFQIKK